MIKYIRGRKNDLGVTTDQDGPSLWPNGFDFYRIAADNIKKK